MNPFTIFAIFATTAILTNESERKRKNTNEEDINEEDINEEDTYLITESDNKTILKKQLFNIAFYIIITIVLVFTSMLFNDVGSSVKSYSLVNYQMMLISKLVNIFILIMSMVIILKIIFLLFYLLTKYKKDE